MSGSLGTYLDKILFPFSPMRRSGCHLCAVVSGSPQPIESFTAFVETQIGKYYGSRWWQRPKVDVYAIPSAEQSGCIEGIYWRIHKTRFNADFNMIALAATRELGWEMSFRITHHDDPTTLPPKLQFEPADGVLQSFRPGNWSLGSLILTLYLLFVLSRFPASIFPAGTFVKALALAAVVLHTVVLLSPGYQKRVAANPALKNTWFHQGAPTYLLFAMAYFICAKRGWSLWWLLGLAALRLTTVLISKHRTSPPHQQVFDLYSRMPLAAMLKIGPRLTAGLCIHCGYDLRAATTDRCSECGKINYHYYQLPECRQAALQNGLRLNCPLFYTRDGGVLLRGEGERIAEPNRGRMPASRPST